MNKVNVFHVGPQKAGTTWLYQMMQEHPGVCTSERHSIHYFDLHYNKGEDWYAAHFRSPQAPVMYDATPTYLRDSFAPQRIRQYNPDATIIMVARNPLERAFSHYWHEKKKGKLNFGFEEVASNYDLFASWIEPGLYAHHLKRYLDVFPAAQVNMLLYDDLQSSPGDFFADVCRICNIDNEFTPSIINDRVNVASRIRGQNMQAASRRASKIPGLSRVLARAYDMAFETNIETLDDVDKDLRASLLDVFVPDIEDLEQYLSRDLSKWKSLS